MTLIDAARADVGIKEKPGQLGFTNPKFETLMKEVGWSAGWPWDALILEKWIKQAMPLKASGMTGFFVFSCMATFRNLKNAGFIIDDAPTPGALVFWQRIEDGFPLWLGHAGIVSKVVSGSEFFAIEGDVKTHEDHNLSAVVQKHRLVRKIVHEGLKVMGFIQVK